VSKRWEKAIQPVVAKLKCAKFDAVECVSFNRDGADALATLLQEMSDRLDWVCDHPFLALWQGLRLKK
jgi:hypothetical protein